MEITNTLFLGNIEFIRKKYNEKVGDLERAIEVSIGYFARLSKNPKTMPGAEVLMRVAMHYRVSIDCLLLHNIEAFTEQDDMFLKFIDKIKTQTTDGNISWYRVNNMLSSQRLELNSMFPHRNTVYTNGVTYEYTLSNGSKTKIIPITGVDFSEERFGGFELMVMDVTSDKWLPVCTTDLVNDMIKMELRNLYMMIVVKESQYSVDNDTKNYLLDFLKQNASDEN